MCVSYLRFCIINLIQIVISHYRVPCDTSFFIFSMLNILPIQFCRGTYYLIRNGPRLIKEMREERKRQEEQKQEEARLEEEERLQQEKEVSLCLQVNIFGKSFDT